MLNKQLKRRVKELEAELERLRCPTGKVIEAEAVALQKLALPGRACLEGVEALLLRSIYEFSGEAFSQESKGEDRAYACGAAASLEQFRVQLLEALANNEY